MKYLIIPDIHGRTFWKNVTSDIEQYEKIIFLGDYVDPYDFEGIDVINAIHNFKEIINFKKENINKVVLLLGNHDIYYYFKLIGPSRYSYDYKTIIEKLFDDNKSLFQIAYEDKECLFTHSGFLKGWSRKCFDHLGLTINPTAESINTLLVNNDDNQLDILTKGMKALLMVSRERGGRFNYGSCIWADVNEHIYNFVYDREESLIDKYQIFGHSLQLDTHDYYLTLDESKIKDGKPIIEEHFAMLDCRNAFEYDNSIKKFKERFKQLPKENEK